MYGKPQYQWRLAILCHMAGVINGGISAIINGVSCISGVVVSVYNGVEMTEK